MKHATPARGSRRWVIAATAVLALVTGAAFAHWTASSTPGGNGAAAATTVNAGSTPSVSAVGTSVTVTWTASTLATGQAVSGYRITRYDQGGHTAQTMLSACNGTVTGTSCIESGVPAGNWTYTVTPLFATNWRGAESADSTIVTVDDIAPVNHLSVSAGSGTAALIGTSLYYRGVEAGSLTIINALTDTGSGPASSATAALGGTSTGWTHSPSTVSTPAGGPYVSRPFSWVAGTTSSPTESVTGRDLLGNTATTNLTFVNDSTAPSAGTISYLDGYQPSRSVSVTFTTGTDSGSGISTRQLQRSAALLTGGSCGTFGSFANVGAPGPTSPYVDSTVTAGVCYKYRYVVRDAVGNQDIATSASIAKLDYASAVTGTAGGLSLWRLGETLRASDTFTGTAGTALTSHTPEIGSTWTNIAGTATEHISTGGRAYKSGLGFVADAAASPATADYAVEADVVVRSTVNGDFAGVIARQDNGGLLGAARYYAAGFKKAATGGAGTWTIMYANGLTVSTVASSPTTTLNDFWEYRLRLEVNGTSLKLYVNGALTVSGTNSALTSAGKAGIVDGDPVDGVLAAGTSDSTGMHLDNFVVTPRAADSKGTNTGDYFGGVVLGQPGALANDPNTAAAYDGVNDYTTVARQISDDFTIELWFNSTQGIGTGTDWWSGAGLVDAEVGGAANDFGISLRSDGRIIAGVGSPDVSIVSSSGGYNNGAWHQVTFTRVRATGALRLYVDGTLAGSATGSTASLTSPSTIYFGRVATGAMFAGKLDEVALYTTPLDQATITAHYQLGSAGSSDVTGPTGGSVDATGLGGTGSRYSTSTTLSLALAKGSDPSGLATSGNELLRASAPLTNGVCGTYGSYSVVSMDPTTPKSDTVADQSCHRYQYVVSDTAGNPTTFTSPDIKVDATAPTTPALAFSAMTNAYWSGGPSTNVYYRSATNGSFTATATSSAASGIASYAYPSLGTGWTSTPGALGVNTYAWTSGPAAPGTKNVTATNNAGAVSAGSPFTLVADDTAPTAGTVSYVDGSTGGSTVSVSFTTGTDSGSGVGTRLLQRASAPFTGITCGTFGSFSTISGGANPTSPVTDSVASGTCYKYQYVVSDNVGNQHTATSTNVAHTPFGAIWTFDQGSGSSAADSSGNGNTATLQAGAGWVAGKVGAWALSLNGATNSYATAATSVDTSQSYSVAAWVRVSSVTGNRTFVAIDGSAISGFYLQLEGGVPKFSVRSADNTSSALTQVAGSSMSVNTWYHLVGVHDKSTQTIKLYVNGVLQGSTAFTTPWKASGSTTIGRGKWAGGNVDFVAGAIDDVRMYDRVLSQAEITALQ